MVPQRAKDILKHVVMAGVAGNIACFLTGCVAGTLMVTALPGSVTQPSQC